MEYKSSPLKQVFYPWLQIRGLRSYSYFSESLQYEKLETISISEKKDLYLTYCFTRAKINFLVAITTHIKAIDTNFLSIWFIVVLILS